MKHRFPRIFYNRTTFVGVGLSLTSLGLFLFLFVLQSTEKEPSPYMGIITFTILPVFLTIGFILILIGAWRFHRALVRGTAREFEWPTLDLNQPRQLRAFTVFLFATIFFLMFSAFGSYKAYEYTESDEFCGQTCHSVMEPEYTAYKHSPHARVGCAKCHIGPGAGWFVRSKLAGSYQVYAVLANKVPRPIHTPIRNLRPAQETCEQCHWPQHFFHEKQKAISYFLSDEQNTPMNLVLLIKIGGGNPETGITSGIHWHMNIANKIFYKAVDEKRQKIPWVRVEHPDGKAHVYTNKESDATPAQLNAAELRRMDCIDCHNRPTHIYTHPARLVNRLMEWDKVDRTLPNLKTESVELLEAKYSRREEAFVGIDKGMREYYAKQYPQVAQAKRPQIQQAVEALQKVYSLNYFPEMKHDWRQFPDNIGHMYAPGCFRCHDGKHVDEEGKVLSRDCNTCHTILSEQLGSSPAQTALAGVEYQHPVDIGDAWKEMNCSDCHAPTE